MNAFTKAAAASLAASIFLVGCGSDDDDGFVDVPEPQNQVPEAQTASFTTEADTALMDDVMATDADGDSLTYEVAMAPSNGELTLNEDGSFTYTPAATYTGSDSFSFTASDGEDTSPEAMVNITVEAMQVSFSTYSRAVYSADANDEPMPVNGREFDQDVTDPNAYDDLLMSE